MVARISMPDEHRDALVALTNADPATIASLAKDLNTGSMTLAEFRAVLAEALPGEGDVAEALIAFNAWRSRRSQNLDEAMPILKASLNGKQGATDIRELIEARAAVLLAKSGDLEYAHANVAQNLRIITDVRPLFGDNPNPEILGSVIAHQLVISTLENNELKDIYVALDTEDLEQLGAQVDRAKKKDEKVRELLKTTGIAIADWQEKS